MAYVVDPERREVTKIERAALWRRKRVIELDCGEGRLTLRLARLGARVLAIEPDPKLIRAARRRLPKRFSERVRYRVGRAERLDLPGQSFDLGVFAWSL